MDEGKFIFLDCQTTGMHPSTGKLLELAWILPTGEERSFLLRLPEGEEIPPRVQDITSITDEHMAAAVDSEIALSALETDLQEIPEAVLVVHYAQFERTFLESLFEEKRGTKEVPARFLCTYKIARKLFPQVPSRNIRALIGYFELGNAEIKRASQHAGATALIWKYLEPKLAQEGVRELADLDRWLAEKVRSVPTKIEYHVDRLKRLELADKPGVYRMLSQSGQVLYVGKATSLKSRVNSYFRGRKGRDRKKLEMLAQVWDIEVTECPSPLEAALLENEEIKRLKPPYNVSLQAGRRKLVFYSRDLMAGSLAQDDAHPVGPFALSNGIELIVSWVKGLEAKKPAQIFYEEVPEEDLITGFWILCARHGLDPAEVPSARSLLALGLMLVRAQRKLLEGETAEAEGEDSEETANEEEDTPVTPEEVADRYEGALYRAASEYLRAKKLTRLLNSHVKLEGGSLEIRGGKVWHEGQPLPPAHKAPWSDLDIVDYDRMSVLHAEVARHSYTVESMRRLC